MGRGLLSATTVLGATVLSLLWWRRDANLCVCEWCPDGYCDFAAGFTALLTRWDAAARDELHQFARSYMHAHNPLAPSLQALIGFFVHQPLASYMILSGLATLVAWLAVKRTIETAWPRSRSIVPLLFPAFCAHILVIRAFARPITDGLGMALTILALNALTRYLAVRTWKRSLVLAATQFVGLLSRVSFIPMLGMPALAELLGTGHIGLRLRRALVSALVHGVVPGALYFALNATLGTLGSFLEKWRYGHLPEFTNSYTFADFLTSSTFAFQGYAIVVMAFLTRAICSHPTFRLHLVWIGLYLTFLGLGGGALWPRYFLPIVPSLFVLSTPVLEMLHRQRPWNVRALIGLFIAGNVLYLYVAAGPALYLTGRLLVNEVRAAFAEADRVATFKRIPSQGWQVTANYGQETIAQAVDGRLDTRWTTGAAQRPGMYFLIDLGSVRPVTALSATGTAWESPRGYTVETSVDGAAWTPIARGSGIRRVIGFLEKVPSFVVTFPEASARYLRITLTRNDARWWAIHELALYTRPRPLGDAP